MNILNLNLVDTEIINYMTDVKVEFFNKDSMLQIARAMGIIVDSSNTKDEIMRGSATVPSCTS